MFKVLILTFNILIIYKKNVFDMNLQQVIYTRRSQPLGPAPVLGSEVFSAGLQRNKIMIFFQF